MYTENDTNYAWVCGHLANNQHMRNALIMKLNFITCTRSIRNPAANKIELWHDLHSERAHASTTFIIIYECQVTVRLVHVFSTVVRQCQHFVSQISGVRGPLNNAVCCGRVTFKYQHPYVRVKRWSLTFQGQPERF